MRANGSSRVHIRSLVISLILLCYLINIFSWPSKGILQRGVDGIAIKDISNAEQGVESRKNASAIQELVCREARDDWGKLCAGGFAMTVARQLLDGEDVNIIQIGAHVGFEKNDPLAKGMTRLLDEVAAIVGESDKSKARQRFHWTFVEPSPPNFHRLTENLSNHSAVCDMKGVNAAVVSDFLPTDSIGNMPFYSLLDTIDPETGYDSLSGKKLPVWITQVSSFSMKPLQHNAGVFRRKGLNFKDYVVVTNVTALPFTKLVQQALHTERRNNKTSAAAMNEKPPLLVLIDTEGFDCDIIKGISPSSTVIPEYLVFEHKQCDYKGASEHLENKLGFDLHPPGNENIVAVKSNVLQSINTDR